MEWVVLRFEMADRASVSERLSICTVMSSVLAALGRTGRSFAAAEEVERRLAITIVFGRCKRRVTIAFPIPEFCQLLSKP